MTEKELLALDMLKNNEQLETAIIYLNKRLDLEHIDTPEFDKLSDLIEEYEDRVDIMNS